MSKIVTKKALEKELLRRKVIKSQEIPFILDDHLFAQQLAFVKDPSRTKVAVCSRRGGKTTACAADLVSTAINNPGTVGLYITLSRSNAKKIIWEELKSLDRKYKLKMKPHEGELSITFPNRSKIYLSGAKDISEIEKFRGMALKLVYVDEAQSFRNYIEPLINDVLSPALIDYSGTVCLIGTPGPIPSGFFYECDQNANTAWSRHNWTFFDNKFIAEKSKKTHQEILDYEVKRRGVLASDPSIQREYFGRWVVDSDSLLIKYNEKINHYEESEVPTVDMNYIMGIDLGFDDADAIAIVGWSPKSPITYLVEETVVSQQGITELVKEIERLQLKYKCSKLVVDQGGLGKKVAEEVRRRHHIPLMPADKARKFETINFLNDSLRTGRFKAKKDSRFAQDSALVEIDKDRSTPDRIKVSSKYHSDIHDAALYAFKESPAYTFQAPSQNVAYRSQQWFKEEHERMLEAEIKAVNEAAEKRDIYGDWD